MEASFKPVLEFSMDLPNTISHNFIKGFLTIRKESNQAGIKLLATSGCQGSQYHRSWLLKGRGCIPPSKEIEPKQWSVSTQRLWLPQVKGVEGSFYAIAPFQVSLSGITRGDLGIHFDANVPGSAGCVVVSLQSHWDLFRKAMEEFRAAGYQSLPLVVTYS